jgi:histidinol-phosphate phosphatase family protein
MINQAVILAGGLGTRLRPITDNIPKPMIQFHGKPFLEYLIELLKEQGIDEIVLLLGYLSEKVVEHFGDGEEFGIKILYSISPVEDDTGLRIFKAKDIIKDEFLLLYCDNYWPLNLQKMYTKFIESQTDALVTIYGNKDGYTKSNCIVDKDDFLIVYDKSRQVSNLNGVDIGFFILKKEVINLIPVGNVNFEKEVMPVLVGNKNIIAYKTDHRYYSVGSHERLLLTEKFLERRPTIILDRDGVINKKAPKAEYITRIEDWEWMPGSREAISLLKQGGYQIVVVTNQAGIARGKMTEEDLLQIHAKMNQDLSEVDAWIDKIYFCPHGWDENCECRKPKPGMLFKAQKDLHLDLSRTYFVGDDERDVEAGIAAGMKTFLLSEDVDLLDFVKNYI